MCFPSPMRQTNPTNPAKYPLAESYKAVRSQATPVNDARPSSTTGKVPQRQSAQPGKSGANVTL